MEITKATNYDAIYHAYQNDKKVVVLEGASRSGKSWDASCFIYDYIEQKQNKQINVVRDYRSILTKTTYKTLQKVFSHYKPLAKQFNKTATSIKYNSNDINFIGVNDNIMTAHGLESDLLWVNEGWSIDRETLNQLIQRTNDFVIIDLNPSGEQHYLYDYEFRDDVTYHKTTIFDNPYAPVNAKEQILSYAHPKVDDFEIVQSYGYELHEWNAFKERNLRLNTADEYLWQVYGLGLRATGTDMIFNANRIKEYTEEPTSYDWKHYGGDFGFSNDPATYTQFIKDGNNLYIRNYIYETGLTNQMLADKIKALNLNDDLSIWDSAEPKSIAELRMEGINALPVLDKNITFGIKRLQRMNLFIYKDDVNSKKEFKNYRWKKNKQGQYVTNSLNQRVPQEGNDHIIDPARYVVTRYLE